MSYAFFRVQIYSGCLTFLLDALRPVVPKRKTYHPVCLTLLGRRGTLVQAAADVWGPVT